MSKKCKQVKFEKKNKEPYPYLRQWVPITKYIALGLSFLVFINFLLIHVQIMYQHYGLSTNLHANSQIVFLDRFVVQRMIDFYVSPSETVVLPLLQVERVELVRLRCGSRHQPIEHGRISLDARAENTEIPISL